MIINIFMLFICVLYIFVKFFKYPKKSINTKHVQTQYKYDKYETDKVPHDIDHIIIGSGISALTTAALLSKCGKKVLILEQNDRVGSYKHIFKLKNIEHEIGINYIGKSNRLKKYVDFICETPIEWCKMGWEDKKWIYNELIINNKKYKFRAGKENFINDLIKEFPAEKYNIIKFVELVENTSKKNLLIYIEEIKLPYFIKYILYYIIYNLFYKNTPVDKSLYDVVSDITNNKKLQAVLSCQFGDNIYSPKIKNFYMYAVVMNYYLDGGYYPRGGSHKIINKIMEIIFKYGGTILVGKKVNKILIKNEDYKYVGEHQYACGVEIENGDKIFVKYGGSVISSVNIEKTCKNLLRHTVYKNDLNNTHNFSPILVNLLISLDGSSEELKLKSYDTWFWPSNNYDKIINDLEKNPENAPIPVFISSSSAKDYSWNERFSGKSSIVISTITNTKIFENQENRENWENWENDKYDKDYINITQMLAKRMLEEGLFNLYPNLKNKVLNYKIVTSLYVQNYIQSISGKYYKIDFTQNEYFKFLNPGPNTNINNLYLIGKNIHTPGLIGNVMKGISTAEAIQGYGTFLDLILNRNIIKDLKKMK